MMHLLLLARLGITVIKTHRSSRSTSFPILIAVNGSIGLILVVANTFFDSVDLI